MDATTAPGMPPRVRTWLDYELAFAARYAGRTPTDPGNMPPDPSPDELCAALPLAADQLERVKILAELRGQLYWHEDILMGELYLAAQQHPDRMDHLYDFIGAVGRARKELGPDVVRWLRDLCEYGPDGIDMEAAEALVRGLHMEEDWAEVKAGWGELVDADLVPRTIWHDGHWRHKQDELIPLHRAEFEAVVDHLATPELLALWKAEPWAWPQPVKTDRDGPWVVAAQWWRFIALKNMKDDKLEADYRAAKARTERLTRHLKELHERTERMQEDYDAAYEKAHRLGAEYRVRVGTPMNEMSAAEVESAIALNAELADHE